MSSSNNKHYAQNKAWAAANPEKMREYKRAYEKRNSEKLKQQRKNSAIRKAYQLKYGRENRAKITKQQAERIANEPTLRLKKNLRNRLLRALKGNYKSGSAVKDLGCSIDDFKIYLESLWVDGMDWTNYGKEKDQWSLDHVRPLSAFDLSDPDEIKKACNYKNLQPMWHIENIKKGNKLSYANKIVQSA